MRFKLPLEDTEDTHLCPSSLERNRSPSAWALLPGAGLVFWKPLLSVRAGGGPGENVLPLGRGAVRIPEETGSWPQLGGVQETPLASPCLWIILKSGII